MAETTSEYEVEREGITYTFLLTKEDADRIGAKPVKDKSRTSASKTTASKTK